MSRVLVVDDDTAVRTVIQTVLEREGFDVVLAKDGTSGIAAIQRNAFDVVIVDIFMPGMDGLETIRVFNKYAPSVPVIAISGFLFRGTSTPAPDFLSMATKLGAAYSLHKPFRPNDLLRVVEACLGDDGGRSRRPRTCSEPAQRKSAGP
jgi:CheY-like chemotaxis protein